VLIAGHSADAFSTVRNYPHGLRESNPLIGGPNAPVGQVLAIKAAETAGLTLVVRRLEKTGHRRAAKIIGYMAGIGGFIPGFVNRGARR
jgi:hypothetical protein